MEEGKIHEEIKSRAENVTKDDLKKAVESSEQILNKVRKSSFLSGEFAKVKLLMMMIKDYLAGEYTEVPWVTIAAAVVAVLYILSPIDLIPDFIPIVGLTDDAAVLWFIWESISVDVRKYALRKSQRDEEAKLLLLEAFGQE